MTQKYTGKETVLVTPQTNLNTIVKDKQDFVFGFTFINSSDGQLSDFKISLQTLQVCKHKFREAMKAALQDTHRSDDP